MELEAEIHAARRNVLGGGIIVDRRRMLELIEALREAIPTSIRDARSILARGEQTIAEAESRAARIVADAEREWQGRLSREAVTKAAEERARQLEQEADQRARQAWAIAEAESERLLAESGDRARAQEQEADRYAMAVLSQLEERLNSYLTGIYEARSQFGDRE